MHFLHELPVVRWTFVCHFDLSLYADPIVYISSAITAGSLIEYETVAELEDILQHREREAEALRIASPLPAALDRPRNAVHTSPVKMDGGRGSSSPQASPIRATREHVSPPAPAPPPPPPSEALSAVLQMGISPPHYPPLAGNGERSETGVMMEVMDKEGAAEMQAELQARLASVETHGDEGDVGKDTVGPVVLEGHHHTDIVNAVAAMGAGVVVSVSADASAVFWGVASGEKLLSVPLAGKGVAVCVAPQDGLPGASRLHACMSLISRPS